MEVYWPARPGRAGRKRAAGRSRSSSSASSGVEGTMSSQSAPVSRPSKSNPADRGKRQYGPSLGRSLSEPLTREDGITLRSEGVKETAEGADAVSWRELVHRFTDYLERTEESAQVFENPAGETVSTSKPHRFAADYWKQQYAKGKDLERGLRSAYGKRLHTAMLTLTASRTTDDGGPRPPVDHLRDLLASWEAVSRSLRRFADGRRVERLAILEPHQSGYLHVHVAVFVDGPVTPEEFRPVIEAHVRNCEGAGREAHGLTAENLADTDAVSVYHAGRDRADGGMDSIAQYLMSYLGKYGEGALEAEDHVLAGFALMWVAEKRRWRPSNGAQQYMAQNRSSSPLPSEWEFVGIEDAAGDVHECSGGGSVSRSTTWSVSEPPDLDSPPDQWGALRGDRGAR